MAITLYKNIYTHPTDDEKYVEMKPSLQNMKNNIYTNCGPSDERLCLYDLLYSIMGESAIQMVTITIEPTPSNAIVKLKIIK